MSIQTYSVDRFIGLNQSGDENLMSPACTPDAANMCTDGGELRVAYGFTRLFEAAVPGTLRIDFFTLYRTNGAEIPVVIAGGVVYAYMENAWTPVYTYQSTRSKPIYDCAQVRINTTDYLVIADGRHGMIKFDGSSVTQFGSEENASNIPVSFLTCSNVPSWRARKSTEAVAPVFCSYKLIITPLLPGTGIGTGSFVSLS